MSQIKGIILLIYHSSHIGGDILTIFVTVLFFWKGSKNKRDGLDVDLDVSSYGDAA